MVLETANGVTRRLPEFVHDPKVCRFKTWLLNLIRWRIQNRLCRRGIERVRAKIEERPFLIFDLYVMEAWSPEDVVKTLGISRVRVYLTKHRAVTLLKKVVRWLEAAAG